MIGGGSIGVSCAYYLAQGGAKVVLLEKDALGSGCIYGTACLITPSHAVPLAAPGVIRQGLKWMFREDSPLLIRPRLDLALFRWMLQFASYCREEPMRRGLPVLRDLCRASLKLFEQLTEREHLEFGFEKRGALYVASTPGGFEKLKHESALLKEFQFDPLLLDGPGVHAKEPFVRPEVAGAVYYAEDAHGDSHRFVTALGAVLQRLGVSVHTGVEVRDFLWNSSRLRGVRTSQGEFEADSVVLAAGSWSTRLARSLRLRVPVQPGKGYSVTIENPADGPRIPVVHQERRVIITPLGQRLRFAGTMEFAGMDLSLNPVRSDAALRGGAGVLREIPNPRILERWCGLRPCTPDGLPILGRVRQVENLYLATGHAMLGFTLGPISGQLIAELVAGKAPSLPLEPLSLDRFS